MLDKRFLEDLKKERDCLRKEVKEAISGTIVDFGTKKPLGSTQEASM